MVEKKLLLSIIVPVYNTEQYLEDCLKSLERQELSSSEYEIICINDGSTDSSSNILDKYRKNYSNIRIINKENEGIAIARNIGISEVQGEYFMFVDSDDFIASYSIKEILDKAIEEKIDFVRFSYSCMDEKKHFKEEQINNIVFKKKKIDVSEAPFQVWGALYRTDMVRKSRLQFSSKFRTREDYIFNFLLYAYNYKAKVLITDSPVYKYRVRNGSLSHIMDYRSEKFQRERLDNMLDYIDECINFITDHPDREEMTEKFIRQKMSYFAATALFCGLRCKSISISDIQTILKTKKVYPVHIKNVALKKQDIIKICLTSFPIINIVSKTKILQRRIIEE